MILLILMSFQMAVAKTADKNIQYDRTQALKNEIVQISKTNMNNVSKQKEIRSKLDMLLAELVEINPEVDEITWAAYAPGSWQLIWSDEKDLGLPDEPRRDRSQIYQYIAADGWGYFFSVRRLNEEAAITFALEVSGSVIGNKQTTTINRVFSSNKSLVRGESIEDLAQAIWLNRKNDFVERNSGHFPNGPIGAQNELTILFLDRDLKIGTIENIYTGAVELFVLSRTEHVQ